MINRKETRRTNALICNKNNLFSIIGNAALATIKGLGGFFGNSNALVAAEPSKHRKKFCKK